MKWESKAYILSYCLGNGRTLNDLDDILKARLGIKSNGRRDARINADGLVRIGLLEKDDADSSNPTYQSSCSNIFQLSRIFLFLYVGSAEALSSFKRNLFKVLLDKYFYQLYMALGGKYEVKDYIPNLSTYFTELNELGEDDFDNISRIFLYTNPFSDRKKVRILTDYAEKNLEILMEMGRRDLKSNNRMTVFRDKNGADHDLNYGVASLTQSPAFDTLYRTMLSSTTFAAFVFKLIIQTVAVKLLNEDQNKYADFYKGYLTEKFAMDLEVHLIAPLSLSLQLPNRSHYSEMFSMFPKGILYEAGEKDYMGLAWLYGPREPPIYFSDFSYLLYCCLWILLHAPTDTIERFHEYYYSGLTERQIGYLASIPISLKDIAAEMNNFFPQRKKWFDLLMKRLESDTDSIKGVSDLIQKLIKMRENGEISNRELKKRIKEIVPILSYFKFRKLATERVYMNMGGKKRKGRLITSILLNKGEMIYLPLPKSVDYDIEDSGYLEIKTA